LLAEVAVTAMLAVGSGGVVRWWERAGAVLALCFAWSAASAAAQPASVVHGSARRPIYGLQLSVDLPIATASAVVGSSWLLSGELDAPACAPRCDPERLPSFDRLAAGRFDPSAGRVSDVGVAVVLAGSSALLLADGGFVDFAVAAQAVLVTSALAVTTMMAVRRPRPFLYGDEADESARRDGNAALAFPSGHTANAFAAVLATTHSLRLRHPGSPWPWVALAGGCALASGVGVTRVLAGDHFPSDVIAGAALGAAVGWVVPELHRIEPTLSVAPGAGGLAVAGSF
jgi:membrane-associated phospholipid phosphatase